MTLKFYKYQGTGNDFVMVDNRTNFFKNDTKFIQRLCDRKFGIGADGLILLEQPENAQDDFKMVYFNADGRESTMCGNGGRCIVRFAEYLGIVSEKAKFTAIDGQHEALITPNAIRLKMQDVQAVKQQADAYFTDTGSPHHVVFVTDVQSVAIQEEGSAIRHSEAYQPGGTNVNFVEDCGDFVSVRTFERGVEAETLSCGTGVTAVALVAYASGKFTEKEIRLATPGGNLSVAFEVENESFHNIWLTGPAQLVFEGSMRCEH